MNIHGIIPPIVTPMTSTGEIDLVRLRTFIDELLAQGVHGIFVLGTTGEFFALDDYEKQAIMATAVEQVRRRVPVYAGTGAESTREVIRLNRLAEQEGVDGVSVITPYYILPTQAEMIDHYRRIAEQTRLPVLLYSNPATCGGLKLEPETVARLAEIPNIVGIKDSSGDLQSLMEMLRLVPPSFVVLQGRDTLIEPALRYGAKGAIPVSSNVAAEYCVGVYESFRKGDYAAAQAYQWKLSPVRLALTMATAPGGIKAALDVLGRSVGPSRSPLSPLPADKRAKLRQILEQAGLMPRS